jgi:hypothetical protein
VSAPTPVSFTLPPGITVSGSGGVRTVQDSDTRSVPVFSGSMELALNRFIAQTPASRPDPVSQPSRKTVGATQWEPAPRWDAAAMLGVGFVDSDGVVSGAWAFSGSARLKSVLGVAGEFGRQGYGYAHCKGEECRLGVVSDLCPCDRFPADDVGHTAAYFLASGSFFLVGPRLQLSARTFAHVLVGVVSTDVLPAQFAVRSGIGHDFGNSSAAFRFEIGYDKVPRYPRMEAGLSGLRMAFGFVKRSARR